jgi:hypothetical protein
VESLERAVLSDSSKSSTIAAGDIKEPEVFDIFGLSNPYSELGLLRRYEMAEMEVKAPLSALSLPATPKDLLRRISEIWPPYNASNVRVFISMLIHVAVDHINSENKGKAVIDEPNTSSDNEQQPSSSKKQGPSIVLNTPATLKAYTDVSVSFDTLVNNHEKILVRGVIDYGVSYAEKSPEALDTFFAVVKAKAIGKLDGQAWSRLICYMGTPLYYLP